MNNPFEIIESKLNRIESLLTELSKGPNISQPANNDQPITTRQLCKYLGVTEPTIIRWRKKGKIPFMRIGSSVRFNLSAVIAALEVKKK